MKYLLGVLLVFLTSPALAGWNTGTGWNRRWGPLLTSYRLSECRVCGESF